MFADVVALYRALNRPELGEGYSYVYDGKISAATQELVERCERFGPVFGTVDVLNRGDGTFRIEVQLPTNDRGRVFHSISDFLENSPTVSFGVLPQNYYIAGLNYSSEDGDKPAEIIRLEKVVQFIRLLTKLADDKVDVSSTVNRLLFILPTDATKVRKTALAEIKIEDSALQFELNRLSLLEVLVAEDSADKLHVQERQLIMRSAIADTLAEGDSSSNDLTYLCEKWPEIRRKYQTNFQAYIQNFAFDDVRKKIVDSELEYASKLTNAFGDIGGKLLALPISVAGVVALDKLTTDSEFIAGCLGLFLVTAVLLAVLMNVRQQISRLQSGYEYVFGPVLGKVKTYPTRLRGELEKRKSSLSQQVTLTRWTLRIFIVLAFLPSMGAAWKACIKYPTLGFWVCCAYDLLSKFISNIF